MEQQRRFREIGRHAISRFRERLKVNLPTEEVVATIGCEIANGEKLTPRQRLLFLTPRRSVIEGDCDYYQYDNRVYVVKRGFVKTVILLGLNQMETLEKLRQEEADQMTEGRGMVDTQRQIKPIKPKKVDSEKTKGVAL